MVLLRSVALVLLICFLHKSHTAATQSHHHAQKNKERLQDGMIHAHLDKHSSAHEHDTEFDHEAILGSVKEVEEFHDLSPEESKKRLVVLVTKMDDGVYIILLIASIGFGHFYRNIDPKKQKFIGFIAGLSIASIVSKYHTIYLIISVIINIFLVLYTNRRICHILSFFVMFGYLLFVRLFVRVNGPTNMIQMILLLRAVGISFEVNIAAQKQDNRTSYEKDLLQLGFLDILYYSFNFIGLLTGPYYSYKTYLDYFRFSFGQYANCTKATIEKFVAVPIYVGIYLLAGYIWPLEYAKSDEFYQVRGVLYRLWYIFPTFLIFRMRMYAGLTLSECVCTITGLGAYPSVANNKSGAGPSLEGYESLNIAPEKHEYDFETIRNMDVKGTETCVTFREGMKTWNMCVQYWLAVVVYKRFPSKQFRTLATLVTSAVWHGIHPGYYFCICGAPFYLPVEDLWNKLVRKDAKGPLRQFLDALFTLSKWLAFSYMGTAFLLLSIDKIWAFYSSVYHIPYILWLLLYLIGTAVKLAKPRKPEKAKE